MVNTASKDILAKLLASENVTVEHKNVQTASFNVKDRILTLPVWEDMTNEVYDLLVGHEVGHALWTGADGWHDAVCDRGPSFKSYLNVIEDARIEKLVQRKYPGLRRSFIAAYKKLFADGFFGTSIDEVNDLNLIDRINTRFKCGQSLGVSFTAEENEIVDEIADIETWEQVVDLAERLYDKAAEEQENNPEPEEDDEEEMSMGFSDGSGEDETDEETESENETSEDGESDSEGSEDTEVSPESGEESDEVSQEELEERNELALDPLASKTDSALRDAMNKEFSSDVSVQNFYFPDVSVDHLIVSHKEILKTYAEKDTRVFTAGAVRFKKFMTNNKKTINYIVKEFEMKKRASEYARTTVAKTGVIDPVKMNSYKFSDDIFMKMSVTPEGKNHGLLMYLDWSGSMQRDLSNTIEQTLNLVMFCRQVNIPFRVYAFSNQWNNKYVEEGIIDGAKAGMLSYGHDFNLLELFTDKMKRNELQRMAGALLQTGAFFGGKSSYDTCMIPNQMWLGATPLDKTIMAGVKIYEEFKKNYRLDIVNSVFLTDGDSHSVDVVREIHDIDGNLQVHRHSYLGHNITRWGGNKYYVIDPVTRKRHRLDVDDNTKTFLEIFRDRTGSNAIGFRILPKNLNHLTSLSWQQRSRMRDELRKQKSTTISGRGYTKFFGIKGGKDLEVANGAIEVASDASKAKIRTAFKKASSGKMTSRVLLNQLVELIS